MHGHHPALSVQQPWAELIITGCKSIEIRSWQTDYRGPLWIHAGRKENPEPERQFEQIGLTRGLLLDACFWWRWCASITTGRIAGVNFRVGQCSQEPMDGF
ncbi:ASCH domain-containing protein [Nitrosospira sp. Nl5]|uniref:ASCH domain-containing protein n=1 Tax=Nitrosospira sp. Nl5 TaxID=200120 RepID=UPI000B897B5E